MLLAYLAAALLAALVWHRLPDAAPWARGAWAGLAATLLLWLIGVTRNNPSVFDPYWNTAPMVLAAAWAADPASAAAPAARQLLVLTLVFAWGLRLGYHWWRTWGGLDHEDWRYLEMRRSSGRLFPLVNLVTIHLMPTLMLGLACLAMYPALVTSTRPFGPLDLLAGAFTLAAIALEAAADRQMQAFRAGPRRPGQLCERGLWAWSRHPNYLGELCFWWGLFLCSLAADPDTRWSAAGPLTITALLTLYSAPTLDRRMTARCPDYAAYMRRVPALLLRRPRR